jgi:hypothetical protein
VGDTRGRISLSCCLSQGQYRSNPALSPCTNSSDIVRRNIRGWNPVAMKRSQSEGSKESRDTWSSGCSICLNNLCCRLQSKIVDVIKLNRFIVQIVNTSTTFSLDYYTNVATAELIDATRRRRVFRELLEALTSDIGIWIARGKLYSRY